MGQGRILVSGELMRELFSFPIDAVFLGSEYYDTCEVLVSHPDIPDTKEGDTLPLLSPTFRKQQQIVFEGWNPK